MSGDRFVMCKAVSSDYDDIMAISKGVYDGSDYLPQVPQLTSRDYNFYRGI